MGHYIHFLIILSCKTCCLYKYQCYILLIMLKFKIVFVVWNVVTIKDKRDPGILSLLGLCLIYVSEQGLLETFVYSTAIYQVGNG